ncbi:MAG: CDP-diacylglycerol--serine O-phosphatidyltransferase [Bacteroidota bacterium]
MKKHFPNFLTLLNLLSGCMAILAISEGELIQASWWIILAAVLDLLDGLLARLLDVTSDIGKQLDSLADVVSFGVAPGFLLYTLTAHALSLAYPENEALSYLSYAGFLIPAFAALRLARFNVDAGQKYEFKGLPTPVTALFILSIPITLNCDLIVVPWLNALLNDPWVLVGVAFGLSALMLAPLKLFSLKFTSILWRHNRGRIILIISGLILFFSFRFASVPFIILLYIVLSQLNLNDQEISEI